MFTKKEKKWEVYHFAIGSSSSSSSATDYTACGKVAPPSKRRSILIKRNANFCHTFCFVSGNRHLTDHAQEAVPILRDIAVALPPDHRQNTSRGSSRGVARRAVVGVVQGRPQRPPLAASLSGRQRRGANGRVKRYHHVNRLPCLMIYNELGAELVYIRAFFFLPKAD